MDLSCLNAASATRLAGRNALAAVDSFEVVESYPSDKYLPGFLIRGEAGNVVFHAQMATDVRKAVPALQCRQCAETELEHQTMLRVDQLLSTVYKSAELEVI